MNGFIDNARVLWRCWRAATKTPVPETGANPPAPPAPGYAPGTGEVSYAASVPGQHPARQPNPGASAPGSPFDRLPVRHGGRVKTIEVWADGRTVITDCRTGQAQTVPGYCPDCADAISAAMEALLRDMP